MINWGKRVRFGNNRASIQRTESARIPPQPRPHCALLWHVRIMLFVYVCSRRRQPAADCEGGREKPTDACEPVSWVLESGDVGEITRMSFTLNIYVKVRISREVEKAKRKTPLSTILKVTNMNTPLHIIVELKLSCAGTCHNTHSSVPFSFRPFSN